MLDFSSLFSMLIGSLAIIIALAQIVGIVYRMCGPSHRRGQIMLAAAFCIAVLYTMTHPIIVPGVGMFDVRALIIGLGVALVSPFVGFATCLTAIAYRTYVAGPGVEAGLATIFLAFTAGYAWRILLAPRQCNQLLKAVTLGAMISLHMLALFISPSDILSALWGDLVPFFLSANMVVTMAFFLLVDRELRQIAQTSALQRASLTDPLTGLKNRRGFERAFEEIPAERDEHRGTGLLLIDVDNFKEINDQFGHAAGDNALITLTKAMSVHVRAEDSFARIGGDEFALLLPDTDRKTVCAVSQAMIRSVERHSGSGEVPTISIGMAWSAHGARKRSLEEAADRALYASKARGRNCVCSQTLDLRQMSPCPKLSQFSGNLHSNALAEDANAEPALLMPTH